MTFYLRIWAQREIDGGTLYRWEADEGASGSGYVIFDSVALSVRPSDGDASMVGDLVVDGALGEVRGSAEGVNRAGFVRVAAAIVKTYRRTGTVRDAAHAYYG
jgi:hypothetical protein